MLSRYLKYLFKCVVIAILVFSTSRLQSQDPIMRKVNLPSSLRSGSVQTIFTSEDGFLWLGTSMGLLKYTGQQFRRYMAEWIDDNVDITSISQDNSGRIWAGFANGDIAYLEGGSLVRFLPEEGTSSGKINSLLFDSKGYMWWGTYGEGVYYYTGNRVYNINADDGLVDEYCYDLEEDSLGVVWVATDAGVSACKVDNERKEVQNYSVKDGLPDFIATSFYKDDDGGIWIGFDANGFAYLDPLNRTFTIPGPATKWKYGSIRDLLQHKGTLWVSTKDFGLVEVQPWESAPPKISHQELPSQQYIGRIANDGMGNIWILADEGLFITTGIHFKLMTDAGAASLEQLHSFLKDRKGDLWFSSDEGLFYYSLSGNIENIITKEELKGAKITTIEEGPDGKILAASFGNGLYIIDPVTWRRERITARSGLDSDHILSLTKRGNDIWLATLGGISRCILAPDGSVAVTSLSREHNLGNNYIYTVYVDSRDRIWFGTDGRGIGMFDGSKMTLYDEQFGLDDDAVYSITEDASGSIWCATSSGSIYRFDRGMFNEMGTISPDEPSITYSLNSSGPYIVAVRQSGIELFDTRTNENLLLNSEIGISGIEADLNSTFRDEEGQIYITTQEGIILFNHEDADITMKPRTVIETLSVFSQPQGTQDELVLGYDKNNISIIYSGMWFLSPEKVRYRVMLEGYDQDWKNTFDDVASYSSLPPGDFTFHVNAFLGEPLGTSSSSSVAFTIKSPFWVRGWFILLVVVLLTSGIFSIVKYRETQFKKAEQIKKEKLEFEFQTLKNQVNPHFLFNSFSTLMSLIEEAPGKAVSYTEKLSDFFRKVLQVKDTDLIPISEELEMIQDYLFILKERFGPNVKLDIDLDEQTSRSYILPMTLQMLIENVVKHNVISRDKPMSISFRRSGDQLIFENTLNQKKSTEPSTGLGLENIRKRYLLLSGKNVRFLKTESGFVVYIPIIE